MEGRGCCCGPQAFTSGILGALACLLVTGGVFLAFHRWDPLWLVVSAVGALLALVGSLLHCCAEQHRPAPQHKGGAAPSSLPPMPEQLVPLSNARSVSQLSLNMLPGYFPPVVAAYGIEQHSAVVQNIVGGQQHLQQRGAKLLLLSLPDHTPQASLHSLVAAVYQLDGNVLTEIPSIPESNATPTASPSQQQTSQPVFKHAEVQTTTAWSSPSQPGTSLDLLDCSAPICDTLLPTDQVLVPLRQDSLVSTSPDAQSSPGYYQSSVRVPSDPSRASVSTETQALPTSSIPTNTEEMPRTTRSSSTTNTKVPSEIRRSSASASTRRSVRSNSRRPSAPADIQVPSTPLACQVTPRSSESTAEVQMPTRSEMLIPASNLPSRVDDGQVPGTSQDAQTALRSTDVLSDSNSITNEMRSNSTDTECVLNANAQKSTRSLNDQEIQVCCETEVSTPVRTSVSLEEPSSQSNPSSSRVEDGALSIEMPPAYSEIPPSSSNEVIFGVPIPSEAVQESSPSSVSQDNATPIHCQLDLEAHTVPIEVSTDSAPSTSSSSSVLIDITNSEAIPSTSMGLNSGPLLDESMLGAVGGGSSELSLSDMDEAELMERSSPPPSYDDVTHERDRSFALAYGTM